MKKLFARSTSRCEEILVKALLIADSPEFDLDTAARLAASSDFIVVTDGAVHKITPRITPHVVCGDFDSIDREEALRSYPHAQFLLFPDQNMNDLEKAVLFLLEKGASEISVVCAVGGRIDTGAANLGVVIRYHDRAPITLHQGAMAMRVVSSLTPGTSAYSFYAAKDSVVSTIALERTAKVSLINVEWPLHNAPLEPGSMGVSNKGLGLIASITVHDGIVLVFHTDGSIS